MDTSVYYTNSTRTVVLIERNRSQLTEIKIFRDGSQIVPTNATYTLYKPDGAILLESKTGSIDGNGTCSYTISAASIPDSISLGEGYVEDWHITISGNVYRFRRMAALVLRRLYPVVGQNDLYNCYSQLSTILPSNLTSYQTYIDTAWEQILRKIRSQGSGYSYLVTSPESFFDAHINLVLSLIFYDFHSNLGSQTGRYYDLAQDHHKKYLDEWATIKFVYQEDESDIVPGEPNRRTAGQPVIYLSGRGNYNRWSWGNRLK